MMLEEILREPSRFIESLDQSLREEIRAARTILGAILIKNGGKIKLEASLLESVSSQSTVLSKEDLPDGGINIEVTESRT